MEKKTKMDKVLEVAICLVVLSILSIAYFSYLLPENYVVLEMVWQGEDQDGKIVRVVVHDKEKKETFPPEWWKKNKDNFGRNQIQTEWVSPE